MIHVSTRNPALPPESAFASAVLMSGELKQQCVDDAGLFDWRRVTATLDAIAGILIVVGADGTDGTDAVSSRMSLAGAREAKAWSPSAAVGVDTGYGFDVVWPSGRAWSFLAPDERSCHGWVHAVNEVLQGGLAEAVASAVDGAVLRSQETIHEAIRLGGVQGDHMQLPPRPPPRGGATLNDSDATAAEEFRSPGPIARVGSGGGGGSSTGARTVPRYESEPYPYPPAPGMGEPLNLSAIPAVGSNSPSQASISDEGDRENIAPLAGAAGDRRDGKRITFDTPSSSSSSARPAARTPGTGGSSVGTVVGLAAGGGGGPQALHTAAAAVELEALRMRVRQLADDLDAERAAADAARRDAARLQVRPCLASCPAFI